MLSLVKLYPCKTFRMNPKSTPLPGGGIEYNISVPKSTVIASFQTALKKKNQLEIIKNMAGDTLLVIF